MQGPWIYMGNFRLLQEQGAAWSDNRTFDLMVYTYNPFLVILEMVSMAFCESHITLW